MTNEEMLKLIEGTISTFQIFEQNPMHDDQTRMFFQGGRTALTMLKAEVTYKIACEKAPTPVAAPRFNMR